MYYGMEDGRVTLSDVVAALGALGPGKRLPPRKAMKAAQALRDMHPGLTEAAASSLAQHCARAAAEDPGLSFDEIHENLLDAFPQLGRGGALAGESEEDSEEHSTAALSSSLDGGDGGGNDGGYGGSDSCSLGGARAYTKTAAGAGKGRARGRGSTEIPTHRMSSVRAFLPT